jgi:toxin-antitoxin system PIN domain toxin
VKVVDLNVLLYAVNPSFEQHSRVRQWWEDAMSDDEPIGLTWIVVGGFIRISTNPRIFPRPMETHAALAKIQTWLNHPNTQLAQETGNHWKVLRELLEQTGSAGNLTTDAHLASLAICHGAKLVSCDNDFGRFPGLRWVNPLRE